VLETYYLLSGSAGVAVERRWRKKTAEQQSDSTVRSVSAPKANSSAAERSAVASAAQYPDGLQVGTGLPGM
jgi:hypothetical protein